jgi:hypothetical protein
MTHINRRPDMAEFYYGRTGYRLRQGIPYLLLTIE